MTCRWLDCECRSWPPVRRVMSTGEPWRIEAAPWTGEPWLYFYVYREAAA